MADFTPTQGRYLSYIHTYTEGFGVPPAESEIAAAIGVSPPSVNQMMKTLQRKGLIRREPGVARSIEILVPPDAIPRWKGKRISRTVRGWTRVDPARQESSRAGGRGADIYRFQITLLGTNPPIWRRIETRDVKLGKLHELIQTAMGWANSHLHQFHIADEMYTDPRFMRGGNDFGAVDYSRVRVSDLVEEHGDELCMGYEYDFGDGWEHEVSLESVSPAEPRIKYPRCIDGDRACPPEDCGGVYGFADFVEAIADPSHSEHEEFLEWHGPFDPADFKPAQATRRMRRGLPTW